MQPLITNPTFIAIHQYLYLAAMIASLITPLAAGAPRLYAFLQRLAGTGGDLGKVFGARRIQGPFGPTPAPASPSKGPGPTVTSALMTVCISALAGILFAMALGATVLGSASCTPAAKTALVNALSVEEIACILANESAGEPPAVAAVCSIPPELVKEVEGLILAARRAREIKDAGR